MKAWWVFVLIGVAGLALGFSAMGQAFREIPPLSGAYTLRSGEVLLGGGFSLALSAPRYVSSFVQGAFGLTSAFQVEGSVGHSLIGTELFESWMIYALGAKVRVSLAPSLDLGFPVSISFIDTDEGLRFGNTSGGAVLSLGLGATVLHSELVFFSSRFGLFMLLGVGLDYDLWPTLRLGTQARLAWIGFALDLSVTMWTRLYPFLDLRLTLNPSALTLEAAAYLRLR
ncbi:MAG: hypothetical protein ACK42E_03755 [Candidatus Bipolaricaulaceae bacterium]